MALAPNIAQLTGILLVEVADVKTGEILARFTSKNLVVTAGRNQLRDRLYSASPAAISYFALGTNATAVVAADTTLGTEVGRYLFTSTSVSVGQLTVKYYLNSATLNGNTLREAGIFNAAGAGTMYCRTVLSTPIVKTASVAVTFTWTLNFSAV